MKAIVYRNYGSPDVLRLEEVDKPAAKDNEVLIKVRAASVNPLDWHFMRGEPGIVRVLTGIGKPRSPRLGVDVAGIVEAAGRNAGQFKPGDEVYGSSRGSFAEYVCTKESAVALKAPNMTFGQAAAVPIAGLTALQGLRDKGHVKAGQRVLINGASGGVGTFAVQIAKWMGAEVTGVSSGRNVDLVRALGADHVIDYTREDFTRSDRRYDMVFDLVSNHPLSELKGVLTPPGVLVQGGGGPDLRTMDMLSGTIRRIALSTFSSQTLVSLLAKLNQADLNEMSELMRAGKVTPVIDLEYKLTEVPEAIRYLEAGHARGKVVIVMNG